MHFFGQFEPPVDRFIFERYFPDEGISGTFVECGAFDGVTECSCRFFEESMGWRGVNLEPVPWIFEKLKSNRPDSINLNFGLSDKAGKLSFESVVHPQFGRDTTIGALSHSPEVRTMLEADGCTFHTIEIDVITWSDLVERAGLTTVDLMVLDVEGHELSVLRGMKDSPVLPHILCVEFGHIGLEPLREAMSALGYVYDITSFANAYFVRHDMIPVFALRRASSESKIPEVASNSVTYGEQQSHVRFLEARERELVELVDAMENSKGWRVLNLLKRVSGLMRLR